VQYVNGRLNDFPVHVYEPFMVAVPDLSRPETLHDKTVYPHVLRHQVFTKPGGQTTTLICGITRHIVDPDLDPDGNEIVYQEGNQVVFPDADGKCRTPPPYTLSAGPVSDSEAHNFGRSHEYDFRGVAGELSRVRVVTAPPPPDPVPIPSCFDTVQREVPRSTTPGSPTDTVTAITGYSRCSEAEYYRYLDADEQQAADHYAAGERYIEQIREEEQRDEPFLICISQEEWEEMGNAGPRCQIANTGTIAQ